ncbi:MAG: rhomboid family intramembrane serine protease, partial [Planctomycetota bacterium]
MGYEDRDYMQTPGNGDSSSIMPGYPSCRFLIFATVILFVTQLLFTRQPNMSDLNHLDQVTETMQEDDIEALRYRIESGFEVSLVENLLQLDTEKVMRGEVWRLVTCIFLHDRFGIWHILINVFFLYRFGREMETLLGSKEFFCFYLMAGLFASLTFFGLQIWLGERIPAVGASGAVLAVVCLYAIYHPSDTIHLFFLFDVPIRILVWLYAIFELHPVLLKLGGGNYLQGTAHAAHLGGLLFGYLYYRFNFRFSPAVEAIERLVSKKIPSRKKSSAKSQSAKPFDASSTTSKVPKRVERLEENLDEIL